MQSDPGSCDLSGPLLVCPLVADTFPLAPWLCCKLCELLCVVSATTGRVLCSICVYGHHIQPCAIVSATIGYILLPILSIYDDLYLPL